MAAPVPFRFTFRAMAAEHELQLFAASHADARRVADAAIADVARIEAKYSRYRDDSVATQINRAAGKAPVAIDAETAALLHYAQQVFDLSDGRFDITSGVLRRAWDFKAKPARLPSTASIEEARALIGWQRVDWDDRTIRLPERGMEIDLGGIGKGICGRPRGDDLRRARHRSRAHQRAATCARSAASRTGRRGASVSAIRDAMIERLP
jgi:thiamine biosynthesis lipoprotein